MQQLQEKIENRGAKFDERSEKWQESSAGDNYQEETERLQDLHLDVENNIEEIESALDNIIEITE